MGQDGGELSGSHMSDSRIQRETCPHSDFLETPSSLGLRKLGVGMVTAQGQVADLLTSLSISAVCKHYMLFSKCLHNNAMEKTP